MLKLTRTFFALQIRQARFCTFPSAWTTSGANSIPNLVVISALCKKQGMSDLHLMNRKHYSLSELAVALY